MTHLIIIDNYDSFTYNIKSYFEVLNCRVSIFKNDEITTTEVKSLAPTHLLLSPGPGNPSDAGITLEIIQTYYDQYPILGICLGHQSIAAAFGSSIIQAPKIMHGKNSIIEHTASGLFYGLTNYFSVTRYHSLIIDQQTLPSSFNVTAWTYDSEKKYSGEKIIMGIQHKTLPLFGIQYHPEAILSEYGYEIFANFIKMQKNQYLFSATKKQLS